MKATGRYRSEIRFIICLFIAGIVSLAVHCNYIVTEGMPQNPPASFFYKLGETFTFTGFADILVFIAAFLLVRYVIVKEGRFDAGTAVLAALFSVLYILVESYYRYYTAAFITADGYQVFIAVICFLGLFVLFYALLRVLLSFLEVRSDKLFVNKFPVTSGSRCFLMGFIIMMVCWLPWMLMNYPGSSIPDAISQVMQFYGDYTFSAHHPPLATYLFGAFIELGNLIWDRTFGFFLYIFFQACFGAFVYAYGISRLHKAGIRLRYCFLAILFFAVLPIWGSYAQSLEKDVLYTEVVTLFHICLIDVVVKKECTRRDALLLILTGIFSALLRKNGIYALIPTLLLLVFYLGKKWRKYVWRSIAAILLVYAAVTKFLYPVVLDIEDASIREALSLPFEQTACYIVNYGDEVTDKEKEVINAFLEYDKIAENYDPTNADPVKALYKGNIHLTFERAKGLLVYFFVWFKMFLKHPDAYFSAAMNMAYGYIAPVGVRMGGVIQLDFDKELPYLADIGIKWTKSNAPAYAFIYLLNSTDDVPFVRYTAMPGFYTWIMMISIFIMGKKKNYREMIIFVPWIMNILVCIASPLGNSMRYALPVAAGMPFMTGWSLYFFCHREMDKEPAGIADTKT